MKATHWSHVGDKGQEPLHYTECGLDDVYLVSGYERETTPYGDGIIIRDLDNLHKAIGIYLVQEKKVLNGKEIRFLRKQMDLTQSELSRYFGLSVSTPLTPFFESSGGTAAVTARIQPV